MASNIVDDVAAITPQWLTEVRHAAGVSTIVHKVIAEPVGTGQMGSTYRLRICQIAGCTVAQARGAAVNVAGRTAHA